MVVPELPRKEVVKIEEVYVLAPETPSLVSKIITFLTLPETPKKEIPPAVGLVVKEETIQLVGYKEKKIFPENSESPKILNLPTQDQATPLKILVELPHANFRSVLGEKVREQRLITQEAISAKTREIYMKRLAGRESGYTYHEIDEMLKKKGVSPNAPQAREFMEKWDREHAERLLYAELTVKKKPVKKRVGARKRKK